MRNAAAHIARFEPTPGTGYHGQYNWKRYFWAQAMPNIAADNNSSLATSSAVISETGSANLWAAQVPTSGREGTAALRLGRSQTTFSTRTGSGAYSVGACGIEVYGVRNVDAAHITSLSFGGDETTDGEYQVGDTLEITANFNGAVTVQGAPTLKFDIGTGTNKVTRTAVYDRGGEHGHSTDVQIHHHCRRPRRHHGQHPRARHRGFHQRRRVQPRVHRAGIAAGQAVRLSPGRRHRRFVGTM